MAADGSEVALSVVGISNAAGMSALGFTSVKQVEAFRSSLMAFMRPHADVKCVLSRRRRLCVSAALLRDPRSTLTASAVAIPGPMTERSNCSIVVSRILLRPTW